MNQAIARAPGLNLGEMGMKMIYRGLDGELDDWVQIPAWDATPLTFSLTCTPFRALRLAIALLREKMTQHDPFATDSGGRIERLGGSGAFHRLPALYRRAIAGFPSPEEYLQWNTERCNDKKFSPPSFPDPNWYWLTYIEPYGNTALRSVHMLEFAMTRAKLLGYLEASLFIGEIHNTDIVWLTSAPTLRPFLTRYRYSRRGKVLGLRPLTDPLAGVYPIC